MYPVFWQYHRHDNPDEEEEEEEEKEDERLDAWWPRARD
jgi:hypothetical protein